MNASGTNKFIRNYLLTIKVGNIQDNDLDAEFTLGNPITIEFDISRNDFSSPNYAQIRLYNLSPYHRSFLRHDVVSGATNNILYLSLQAGYGANSSTWPVIFAGNATQAYSHREGVDFVTTIEAFDAGYALQHATVNLSVPTNTPIQSLILASLQSLSSFSVSIGAVSEFSGNLIKGTQISGYSVDILNDLTNNAFFIDNNIAHVVVPEDAIASPGNPPTINSATGLLSTPYAQQQIIDFDMLFEPLMYVNMIIDLQAISAALDVDYAGNTGVNGLKKVIGVKHRGVISLARAGSATTSIRCIGGNFNKLITGTSQ